MFLLDTNILSELRKGPKSNPNVDLWSQSVSNSDQFLSAITLLEIEIGILRLIPHDPHQAQVFDRWLRLHVLPIFQGRIFPVDTHVALQAAKFLVPRARSDRDALIAATALVHDLIVVTRNVSDFLPTGVRVLNPFDANPKVISA